MATVDIKGAFQLEYSADRDIYMLTFTPHFPKGDNMPFALCGGEQFIGPSLHRTLNFMLTHKMELEYGNSK